jgi:hypothetical protein
MLGEGVERSSLNAGSAFGVGQSAVDEEICVPADGRGEVGVVGFGQAEMSQTFGRVDGPFQGAKKTDLEGIAIWATRKKF